MDRFESMQALVRSLPASENYSYQIDNSHRSRIRLFAPHGGCIEPCTGPLVLALAGGRYDYFIFHGLRRKDCHATLHVTSTHYDDPACLSLVSGAELAIAIHGCEGREEYLEIGGGNVSGASDLRAHFSGRRYDARLSSGGRSGEHADNFVNRAIRKGIQVEMSAGFRRLLFPDFPRPIRRHPELFQRFVQDFLEWIGKCDLEMEREVLSVS